MATKTAVKKSAPELPPEEPVIDERASPCPFCGGPATLVAAHQLDVSAECCIVSCEDEEGKSCPVGPDAFGKTVTEALALWNTRAS